MILHTEFRDGNVHAGYEQLRVFKEALDMLPEGVTKVYLRSDTAGYQHDLLKYCEKGENKRFGRIEFAVSADVTKEFKKAVAEAEEWKPVMKEMRETGKEWAEVCFVPNVIAFAKNAPVYRYLATRELLAQPELPGMEAELPFPTMTMGKKRYKVFGIVTNRDTEGNDLIDWLRKRCGKSEEAHSVMKEDLAGGKLPSSDFGENAAWWWIMILAFNLNIGDEATCPRRLMGDKEDEGHPLCAHQPARKNHRACPGPDNQARTESPLLCPPHRGETEDHEACAVMTAWKACRSRIRRKSAP